MNAGGPRAPHAPPGRIILATRFRYRIWRDKRLGSALVLSMLVHVWVAKLNLGGDGTFGFGALWQARRIEAPDLRVTLAPPPPAPVPRAESPRDPAPVPTPAPPPPVLAAAAPVAPAPAAEMPRVPEPVPPLLSIEQPARPAWVAPPTDERPHEGETARAQEAKIEAAQLEADRAEAARSEQARIELAKAEATRIEQAKVEAAKAEATRVEQAKVEAAEAEAARIEQAKLEAAKADAMKREQVRLEAAKAEVARMEAAKAELANAEAAKAEAARKEQAKAEAAKAEAAKAEAAKAEAAKLAAVAPPAPPAEDPREARLRALGKLLDEEADRRKAAEQLPLSVSAARRYRLFGRSDPNAAIARYAEVWSRKIEMNMTFDTVRDALKQPYRSPMVTVAIRGNGTVESIRFVTSSGVAALDEAIRNVVMSQVPYAVFPPELAVDYDVIEIRRTWQFDSAIRLY